MVIKNLAFVRIHEFGCTLDEISSMLQLKPTDGWVKGDLIAGRNHAVYRKQSTWEIKSSISEEKPIVDHINFLLNPLEPRKKPFVDLISKYEGELSIVVHVHGGGNPGINIGSDLVKRINELGVEIDFDLYFYP